MMTEKVFAVDSILRQRELMYGNNIGDDAVIVYVSGSRALVSEPGNAWTSRFETQVGKRTLSQSSQLLKWWCMFIKCYYKCSVTKRTKVQNHVCELMLCSAHQFLTAVVSQNSFHTRGTEAVCFRFTFQR